MSQVIHWKVLNIETMKMMEPPVRDQDLMFYLSQYGWTPEEIEAISGDDPVIADRDGDQHTILIPIKVANQKRQIGTVGELKMLLADLHDDSGILVAPTPDSVPTASWILPMIGKFKDDGESVLVLGLTEESYELDGEGIELPIKWPNRPI